MTWLNIFGSLAAIITTAAFFPQVIKAHQTKHTKDISLVMYLLLVVGLAFWTIYGFMIDSWPIIWANLITIAANLYLVFLKLKYG